MKDWRMISRRNWIQGVAAASPSVLLSSGFAQTGEVEILDLRLISQTPYYAGWPTLTRRKNGELLLVYSGGRKAHVCPFGRVELMRSRDNGATWSFPRVILDGPIDDRDAGILETTQGSILVTTFTSLAYASPTYKHYVPEDPEELSEWNSVHERISEAQRQEAQDNWMVRSMNDGISFSGRYRVPVNSPHGPIQLSDGRQLYAGVALWTDERKVGVCESRDDGQTWTWLADIPTREGDDHKAYHELHAVEAMDGRIIVHIRNHNPNQKSETLQCESDDGGETWTVPHEIGVWGLPSHLLRLKDNRILMSYGYRRKPWGNQVRVSGDSGRSWSPPITLTDDGTGSDLGYPSTVSLDDGSFVTVWYEKMGDAPGAVLRQAIWKMASTA